MSKQLSQSTTPWSKRLDALCACLETLTEGLEGSAPWWFEHGDYESPLYCATRVCLEGAIADYVQWEIPDPDDFTVCGGYAIEAGIKECMTCGRPLFCSYDDDTYWDVVTWASDALEKFGTLDAFEAWFLLDAITRSVPRLTEEPPPHWNAYPELRPLLAQIADVLCPLEVLGRGAAFAAIRSVAEQEGRAIPRVYWLAEGEEDTCQHNGP